MTVGGEGGSLRLEDAFLDTFEVTNREYKKFVDAAGYRTRDWNEPTYQFQGPDARLPIDRSANNGFRLMKRADASPIPEAALRPLDRLGRDLPRRS